MPSPPGSLGHVGPTDGGDFRPPHPAHKQQPRDGVGAAPHGGHLIGLDAAAPTASLGVPTGVTPAVSSSASRSGRENRADRRLACQYGSPCHALLLDVCKS